MAPGGVHVECQFFLPSDPPQGKTSMDGRFKAYRPRMAVRPDPETATKQNRTVRKMTFGMLPSGAIVLLRVTRVNIEKINMYFLPEPFLLFFISI